MLFLLPRNSTEYKPKGRFFLFVYKPKGRFFRFIFNALKHWCLYRNMPKACPYVKV